MTISQQQRETYSRYLTRYGEPEIQLLNDFNESADNVLVIPAYQETLAKLESAFDHLTNMIVILVVNSPNSSDLETSQLLADIRSGWMVQGQSGGLAWYATTQQNSVIVVDRHSHPINIKQGVGKARKIGADIALQLILQNQISRPWIYSTDADARLPVDYFADTPEFDAFQIYPFRHEIHDDLAAALYEFSVLWYAFGLQYAGSKYAFPSVGSCIACCADAYAKVRGFPQRPAGEDFYLLNKLRKIGCFSFSRSKPIELSSRRSDRVPFGTGPGISKIDEARSALETSFYHPDVFVRLKAFLQLLGNSQEVSDLHGYFSDPVTARFVGETNLIELLAKQQKQTVKVYQKFLSDWFDGFRTLKFVHLVRSEVAPSIPFQQIWDTEVLPFSCPGTAAEQIQRGTQLVWQQLVESHRDDVMIR